MKIDQIHFYVDNASRWRDWFTSKLGFHSIAAAGCDGETHLEVVKSGKAEFVLYAPLGDNSPVSHYLQQHPPGVAGISFEMPQLEEKLPAILSANITLSQPLQKIETAKGCLKWCQILGLTGLSHTLVERQGITPLIPWLPQWKQRPPSSPTQGLYFTAIDHLVLNVAAGALEPTVQWYETVFGWERKQAFSIQTPNSGLHSQVLGGWSVQFPINEPSSHNSQIQEFLNYNRGAGIQHIALSTSNVPQVTLTLKQLGLSFLSVPNTYYTQLKKRFPDLPLSPLDWEMIQKAQVLVDSEASNFNSSSRGNPLLLQIFTKPIFAEPTFFFELIERRDRAQGFGEGNFQALFEAIEREQLPDN